MMRLEIVEQPQQRGMRFRYECEGRSAGSIPGENTTGDKKTWPSCQIVNYSGHAVIRVSLVSKDDPPRPHPHSLVGRDCEKGVCQINVGPDNQMLGVFPNLGIQCVRRKEVTSAIYERIKNQVNPFGTILDGDERSAVDVDLNIVRLCFEAFLPDPLGNFTIKLNPVVSNPIFDKKATCAGILKICRVDKTHGSAQGNDEVFLLCDKVQKEDIQVVFSRGNWEALAEFSSVDVHRQVAIVFRTPPYLDQHIHDSVEVQFKLRRPSDQQVSKSLQFTYLPIQHDGKHKIIPNLTMPAIPNDGRDKVRRAILNSVQESHKIHGKRRHPMDSAGPSGMRPNIQRPPQQHILRPPMMRTLPQQQQIKREPMGVDSMSWDNFMATPYHAPHNPQSLFDIPVQQYPQPGPGPSTIMPDLDTGNASFSDLLNGTATDSQEQQFPSIGPELTGQILEQTVQEELDINELMQKNCSIENNDMSISEYLQNDINPAPQQPIDYTRQQPPQQQGFMPAPGYQVMSPPQNHVMSPTTPLQHTPGPTTPLHHTPTQNMQMFSPNPFGPGNYHANNNNNQMLHFEPRVDGNELIDDFLKNIPSAE